MVNRTPSDLFASAQIRRLYARGRSTRELPVPMKPYLKEAFQVPNTYPAWP